VFDDQHSSLFFVVPGAAPSAFDGLPLRVPGVRAFLDADGAICKLYGIKPGTQDPVTYILSPRLQICEVITSPAAQHADDVHLLMQGLAHVDALPAMLAHPPVLIIPNVFEAALCKALIKGYQDKGGRISGFMRDMNGRTVEVQDSRHKVRRDWSFDRDSEPELVAIVQNRIRTRVVPEIKKAFQFSVTRMERYLVSCYRADEGGHFRAHRDDTTLGTAHRRFAVSLNLNADAYEGGDLRFPEFGHGTYRPPSGGCCVFSCSLLHEATPVLKGERYAFLPFLYDEEAKKIRDANLQFIATSPEN
jgi:predicted 2-oxoglutarate/Fe(II)-dependent dioxygenase YbiX